MLSAARDPTFGDIDRKMDQSKPKTQICGPERPKTNNKLQFGGRAWPGAQKRQKSVPEITAETPRNPQLLRFKDARKMEEGNGQAAPEERTEIPPTDLF